MPRIKAECAIPDCKNEVTDADFCNECERFICEDDMDQPCTDKDPLTHKTEAVPV